MQFVAARGPVETKTGQRRHQHGQQRGIVVGRDATVDEQKLPAPQRDLFGRKECRRGRAGPEQLPERNLQIAIGQIGRIVFRQRIVGNRPGRAGGRVPHYDQQQRLELLRIKQRGPPTVLLELFAKKLGHPLRAILCLEPAPEPLLREHRFAMANIKPLDLGDGIPPGEASGNDRARARAGEEVDHVGQHQIRPAMLLAKDPFDTGGDLQREDATNAATVEGHDSLHACLFNIREPAGTVPILRVRPSKIGPSPLSRRFSDRPC